ncbi:Doublesex- and mab-3-related transcription factor [Dirofilaria immitis]
MRNTLNFGFLLIIVIAILFSLSDCATKCYVGKNSKYISRSCEGGGSNSKEFVCQKFICEGGKSPFILRTCANKRLGCLAGPSICRFSGGIGSCARCRTNNYPTIG